MNVDEYDTWPSEIDEARERIRQLEQEVDHLVRENNELWKNYLMLQSRYTVDLRSQADEYIKILDTIWKNDKNKIKQPS